jgi:poly(hydroxyalkanoate) depolymerase family esterase
MHRLAVAAAFLCALSSCEPEGVGAPWAQREDGLTAVTNFGSNPGGLALFLHEPANLGANAPLVVALHGCTQTAAEYANSGWNALADQHRFLVAYPQTTANSACFDWFSSAQQSRSGAQVTSLLQMVQHLVATRGAAPSRVYVTGLSAGGAMAGVLLAVASDVFSRGAVFSGLPFGCAGSQGQALGCMTGGVDRSPSQWGALVRAVAGTNQAPRVMLWHGTSDGTVSPANLREQLDQWSDVAGIDVTADATVSVGAATRREYRNASGTTLVETWTVAGMTHGTPVDPSRGCGTSAPFLLDVGLCSSRFAAEFFGLISAPDAGTEGGGGGSATGGGGGSATGGGGGSATGGGGGSATNGGGGSATGGGADSATDGGGGSATGGGSLVTGDQPAPAGCGCASVDPLLLGVGVLLLRAVRGRHGQARAP